MSLRDVIRDTVAQAGDEPDIDEVTKHVLNTATDEDIEAALFTMVRQTVLNELHLQATASFVDVIEDPSGSRPGPSRIARAVAARDRFLGMVVCLDQGDGRRKRLGVCSLDDVRQIIENRRTTAKHFNAEADRFERLAEAMVAEKASTPANISPATLERIVLGWRS